MMTIPRSIIALGMLYCVLCCSTYGGPRDVPGWEKTRWGMHSPEIRTLYAGKLVPTEKIEEYANGKAFFGIDSFMVAGVHANVRFVLRKDSSLVSVVFKFLESDSLAQIRQFNSIEKVLRKKYGKPALTEKKLFNNRIDWTVQYRANWAFPSTDILLTLYTVTSKINRDAIRFFTLVFNASESVSKKIARQKSGK
jgi:hypothetical protein